MKKTLILLIALLVIVSGCGKSKEENTDRESTKVEEVSKEGQQEQEEQENKEDTTEEQKEETKKEETTNKNNTKKEQTTTKNETKKEDTSKNNISNSTPKKENTPSIETNSKEPSTNQQKKEEPVSTTPTLGANEYYSVKTGKVHKYTFTYSDEATCVKKGDGEPYDVVYPIKPYVVFGCEQVKDANGNVLWGEYFYSSPDESSIFYW